MYVGVHSTYNLDDGYLGSGFLLKRAIKKYGTHNFKRQILHYCLSENHSLEYESMIVNETFLTRSDVYNLKLGGGNKVKFTQATKEKIRQATFAQLKAGNLNCGNRKGATYSKEHCQRQSIILKGKQRTQETKDRIRASKQGVKRSQCYLDSRTNNYKLTSPDQVIFFIKGHKSLKEFTNTHLLSFNNLLKHIGGSEIYLVPPNKLNKKSSLTRIKNTNGWKIEIISN
jgi:hypothetical protein